MTIRTSQIRPSFEIRKIDNVSEVAEDHDLETVRTRFRKFKRALEQFGVSFSDRLQILEVGSGANEFLAYLHSQDINAVGVEVRPRGQEVDRLVVARVEQLPFAEATFDVVTSSLLFDRGIYQQQHRSMLSEIARVLRPQGFYLSRGDAMYVRRRDLIRVKRFGTAFPVKLYQKF
jgi:SAM-dependent methyltransferase